METTSEQQAEAVGPYEPAPPTETFLLTTTLARLRKFHVCGQTVEDGEEPEGYSKLVRHLGDDWPDDKPINLLTILESNDVEDCLWCCCATLEDAEKFARLFAADCAEHVLHFFERERPDDNRPRAAIDAARQYARGEIDHAAWAAAWAAARAAARDAAWAAAWAAARAAARDAAWAAAGAAAWAAARDAARAAARDAARAAAMAAAAGAAAWAAAGAAAWAAEREWQEALIRKYLRPS